MNTDNWIGVDWGTSHLRVWKIDAQCRVLDHRCSNQGMNSLRPDQFEAALLELLDCWLDDESTMQVIACGMVGSRQGWAQASYLSTPCTPQGKLTHVISNDSRINVNIIPGVKQLEPADVMRGEETQIAGLLVNNEYYSGVVCLPGTHSKWANVVNGKVVEFQTFLTGELFSLLSKQSVLRHSLDNSVWDQSAFQVAVQESITQPQSVSAQLFPLRAQSLIGELSSHTANSRLSGLLIGLELANCKKYWLERNIPKFKVVIIGEPVLSKHYITALNLMQIDTQLKKSETMTLLGLSLAYKSVLQAITAM